MLRVAALGKKSAVKRGFEEAETPRDSERRADYQLALKRHSMGTNSNSCDEVNTMTSIKEQAIKSNTASPIKAPPLVPLLNDV